MPAKKSTKVENPKAAKPEGKPKAMKPKTTKASQPKAAKPKVRPKADLETVLVDLFEQLKRGEKVHTDQLQAMYGLTEPELAMVLDKLGIGEIPTEKEKRTGQLTTKFDQIVDIVQSRGRVGLRTIASELGIDEKTAEEWVKMLMSQGIVEMVYPVSLRGEPQVSATELEPKVIHPPKLPEGRKKLASYVILADNVPTKVTIFDIKGETQPLYHITYPVLGPGTECTLGYCIGNLAKQVAVQAEDMSDTKRLQALKEQFLTGARQEVLKVVPNMEQSKLDLLTGIMLHRSFGLGQLEVLMSDDHLEEVAVNGSHVPVAVYHREHGWLRTTIMLPGEDAIYNYSSQIGRKVGRQITTLDPLMDAHLLTGDRVAATLFPISTKGNTITIRRFARRPWTIIDFINPKSNSISKEIAAFLWLAMQYELNVLVAGGTGSGKTSLLNALAAFIPSYHRILTIEDTRELNLPKYLEWNWVPLTTREANPEGKGEISMLDLMVSALRMRPDRVILGEIRRRDEAEVLFEAMHTGHSVYSTLHAERVEQVYRRLIEPPISIPESELEALHVVLTQFRDRRTGRRRTYEVAELIPGGYEGKTEFNIMYRWSPRNDTFDQIEQSQRVFNDLNLYTGMTLDEIKQDLSDKEAILQWMLDKKLNTVDQVGSVMRLYYKDPDVIVKAARGKKDPKTVL